MDVEVKSLFIVTVIYYEYYYYYHYYYHHYHHHHHNIYYFANALDEALVYIAELESRLQSMSNVSTIFVSMYYTRFPSQELFRVF